jgi:hypothetical protein
MKKSDLEKVLSLETNTAVSIYAPTHKRAPENQADQILVKNLVNQAQEKLLELFDKKEIQSVLDNLTAALESVDFAHTTEGLAMLVSDSGFHTFNLSHSPIEQVSIASDFSLAELAKTANKSFDYHLLVLSESPSRLFRGNRDRLTEIKGDFPIEHTGRGGAQGLPTDYGQQTSVIEDEEHRKFFREVAEGLTKVQAKEKLPLIVTGVTRFLAHWKDVAPSQQGELSIEGSYDFMSEAELTTKLWPEIETYFRAENKKVLADLDAARSQKLYAGGFEEVEEMAEAARVQTLVVSDDEVANPAVERAVRATLAAGGDVYFVPAQELAGFSAIAAKLRF